MKRTLATWEVGAAACDEECRRMSDVLEKAQVSGGQGGLLWG